MLVTLIDGQSMFDLSYCNLSVNLKMINFHEIVQLYFRRYRWKVFLSRRSCQ